MKGPIPQKDKNDQGHRPGIDDTQEAVVILDVKTGKFVKCNQAAIDLLHYSRQELRQYGPLDISPPSIDGGLATELVHQHIRAALRGGNPSFDWIHVDREGCEIPCQVRLVRFPPYDQEYVRASITDLTEDRQREALLRSSTIKLEEVQQLAKLGIFETDLTQLKTWWSKGMYEIFELSPGQIVPSRTAFLQLVHPDDQEEINQQIQTCIQEGLEQKLSYRLQLPAGRLKYMNDIIRPVKNALGKVVSLIGTSQDVTKQREATERLEYQATLLDNTSDAVVCTDPSFRIQFWNRAAEELYGWRSEEVIGRRLNEVVPVIYPDSNLETVLQEFLQAGRWQGEVIQEGKQGRQFYVQSSVRAVYDEQGNILYLTGLNRDISDRKRSESMLKKTLEQFQLANKTAQLGVWQLTVGTGQVEWNDRLLEIYGISRTDFEQDPSGWMSQVHPDDQANTQQRLEHLHEGNEVSDLEFRIIRPSGEVRFISASGSPLYNDQGQLTELIGINIDVTNIRNKDEALREQEAFHRAIFENSLTAILVVDDAGRFRSFNQAAIELLGGSADQLKKMLFTELPFQNISDPSAWFAKFIDKGREIGEFIFRLPDQTMRTTQYQWVRVKTDFNLCVLDDITDRKKAEEALRLAKEYAENLIDTANVMVVGLDQQGLVTVFNRAAEQITGYTRRELLGKSWFETLVPSSQYPEVWTVFNRLKTNQLPRSFENPIRTKSGEERLISWQNSELKRAGSIIGTISFGIDITQRKQAERELAELTNRFRISTRAARVGIWDWDIINDRLIWDNTMFELYGISREQFTGMAADWQRILHPDDLGTSRRMVKLALRGKREYNNEFRIVRPDGTVRYIKAVGSVQRDAQGRGIRMVGTNWDITQEKEIEQQKIRARQLELRNRELEQFAYVASHDLQEPLRTVISFVGLLEHNYHDQLDQTANEYLQFVTQAASRMSNLIKGLLEYSLIGTDRELITVDCHTLVRQTLNDLSVKITESQAHLDIGPLPVLQGYETELRILFQNLIINAIKFRREGVAPMVRISAREDTTAWEFAVQDNGIGIDPKYQKQIFVIFQRLHGRNSYPGTGIGLAHCQKIVNLHGGNIWVASEPGQGSTFFFTLAKQVK